MIPKDNIVMNDVYRRIHQFHKGNLDATLIALNYPSEVKRLKKWLKPYTERGTARALNWYNLTEEGKELFGRLPKLSHNECIGIFNGGGVDFTGIINHKA